MIRFLEECSKEDVSLVGGKGASLGELSKAGKQVPPGFSITVNAYRKFAITTGINELLTELMSKGGEIFDDRLKTEFYPYIENAQIPKEIEIAVRGAYRQLCERTGDNVLVAVRSSATMEDSANMSFAGQHETFLNVYGEENVLSKTLQCWASMFSSHALHYRSTNEIKLDEEAMAVVVQKMVNAKVSGVAFTVDPVSGNHDRVVIDAAWGLGEGIVGGFITPDHFVVDKKTLEIKEQWISPKTMEFIRDPNSGETVPWEVPMERQKISCLTAMEIKLLAQTAISIEGHYGRPQDIEWALDRDVPFPRNLLILQSRPVTVWGGMSANDRLVSNH